MNPIMKVQATSRQPEGRRADARHGSSDARSERPRAADQRAGNRSNRDWGEIRWAVGIGLVVVCLAQLPYLVAYLVPADDMVFSGAITHLEDVNSYLAKIRQGMEGQWLFQNRYTPEPHPGGPLYILYILLGHVAAVLNLSPQAIFAWTRVVADLILLATAYWFLSLFVAGRRRRTAFLLVCVSSGLGWMLLASGQTTLFQDSPIDLWVPEAITFFSLMTSPHSALSTSLLLASLGCLLVSFRQGRWTPAAIAALAAFALAWIHPFVLAVVYAVIAVYLAWRTVERRAIPSAMIARASLSLATSLPVLVYLQFSVIERNPVFRAWAQQNDCISPNPLAYIVGYGLILALALAGIWRVLHGHDAIDPLPLCWVGAVSILLYAPTDLQRRFIQGTHVPLCLLAALGWEGALRWQSQRRRRVVRSSLRVLLVVGLVASNLFLWAGALSIAIRAPDPFFIHEYEVEAMSWLEKNTEPDDTVLCSWDTGSFVPAWAGNRVVIGHWAETLDVAEKKREVERFFDAATSPQAREEIVEKYGVRYLLYGPNERSLGGYDPGADPLWARAFANEGVRIYRLVDRE